MVNNDWQDKLRSGMENYSEPVPDSVWNAVSAGVSGAWDRQRRLRRRRRMYAAAVSVSAAAALVLALLPSGSGDIRPVSPERRIAYASAPAFPSGMFSPAKARELVDLPSRSGEASAGPDGNAGTQAGLSGVRASADEEAGTERASLPSGEAELPGAPSGETSGAAPAVPEGAEEFFPLFADDAGRRSGPRVALNFRASNLASGASGSAGYSGMFGSTVMPSAAGSRDQVDGYSSVLMNNNSMEVATSTRYWQPVSVGVTASLSLTDNLAVESGLNYSCLISDLSSGTAENRYDIRQTLHYIGVPLRLRLSLWTPGNFDIYLSAGGEVEKCVYGTTSTTYFVDSSPLSSASARIDDDRLQWSAGASVGLGYRFNDFLGIYAEPGVSWHFSNGSFVESVYSRKPFNFSLALGLRFYLN